MQHLTFFRVACNGLVGNDFYAVFGDGNSIFPLSGKGTVFCVDSPAVFFILEEIFFPFVYHRFDGEYHAGNQQHAGAFFADVAYIGFFVEVVADAVTADVMEDGIAMGINMFADDFADVTQMTPGFYFCQSKVNRFFCDFHQFFGFVADLTNAEHTGCVCVITIQNGSNVYVDDVPILEDFIGRGDTMADDIVYRCADTLRESA